MMVVVVVVVILPVSSLPCHVLGPFIAIKLRHTLYFSLWSWSLDTCVSLLVTSRALSHASVSGSSEKKAAFVLFRGRERGRSLPASQGTRSCLHSSAAPREEAGTFSRSITFVGWGKRPRCDGGEPMWHPRRFTRTPRTTSTHIWPEATMQF